MDDALHEHALTGPLLQAIEDSIARYRDEKAREAKVNADWPGIEDMLTGIKTAIALAGELRSHLPVFTNGDETLMAQLEERAAAWSSFINIGPYERANHRPQDEYLGPMCLSVVEALAAANVPLKVGRKSVVTDVLGLVSRIAKGRAPLRDGRSSTADYELTRDVVNAFRSSKSR